LRGGIKTGSSFLDAADVNVHVQDVSVTGEALSVQSEERWRGKGVYVP